jgi:serine/threonine protein kinase
MQDSTRSYHANPEVSQASKNYEVVAELGHGAQGSVYLVREERTSEMFAAKVVSIQKGH